ncbi:class I SAM-dependent methyltransferase [Agromyces ramosus]|uniref:SAM-dependent methyltransferase n=1 Tax=Agromyces ramosus TaxID=33879 RepID=A0ABU0R6B9_9MICO|nr:class I SAM-dependent methyltransferase [Agromyces ramosus]MDQ0893629.1 SAM-dependent methyltransferase [Agromyces ramosus]
MGDTTREPDFAGGFAAAAASFAALDDPLWDPISTAAVLRAHPRFDELVLDACSGDGASAIPTAELVGVGGVVDAVDFAEPLVDLARERAGERMPQLRFHVADVTSWEPTGYDLVQCVLGVFFFDDMDAGTRHLIERAHPGGRVAITVWAEGALEPLPELLVSALPEDAASELGDLTSPAIDTAGTPGSLAQWLTGLGLVQVRAEAVQRHLDLTPELAWALVLGTGLRLVLGELDEEAVSGVRERYVAALEERGVTSIDITTLIAVGRRRG